MLSVNLVYYLKVKSSRKVAVVACFAPRTLVVGSALTRLIYLFPITPHTKPEFNLWIPVICTQVQVGLSIVTACIPYMRPFFYSSESKVPEEQGPRRRMMKAEESYTYYSSNGYGRGHKRQGPSQDSAIPESWNVEKTPDVTPRIPSPAPLSPLLAPVLITPANSNRSSSRSPSERGLKLHIPQPAPSVRRATFMSPQTASSYALSPDCVSPVTQPFLAPNPNGFCPMLLTSRSPTPPLPCHTPTNGGTFSGDESDAEVTVRTSTKRFSLFPSLQAPRYSLVPQITAQPPTSQPLRIRAHSRSNDMSPTGATSMSRIAPHVGTSETQTTSPTTPAPHAHHHHLPPAPVSTASRRRKSRPEPYPGPHLVNIAYDDPLRITSPPPPATALTTGAPVSAPVFVTAPLPAVLESPHNTSIPSSIVITPPAVARPTPSLPMTQTPGRRLRSESNPTTASPSHYAHTPPLSHPPPTGPLPQPPTSASSTRRERSNSSPYRYPSQPYDPPLVSPTSPQRQRNRRILTPKNSSREFTTMSPISPISPSNTIQFWREEAFGNGAGRTATPSFLWEEQDLRPAAPETARNAAFARASPRPIVVVRSPRIFLQRAEQ